MMALMNNPVSKAKWVIDINNITGIPAESLRTIAESEGINFMFNDYPEDIWDGMLLWKGNKKVLLVNTHWGNAGRHNFTFAHELGHYFMEHPPSFSSDGQSGFKCTNNDIEYEQKPRETEANKFAAELLMPEDRFKFDMIGADVDFTLINSLANHYMVSKHACSNRIMFFTMTPCIIIRTKGQKITGYCESRSARGFLKKMDTVPGDTAAYYIITNQQWQNNFVSCKAEKWLMRIIPSNEIYECTHIHRGGGTVMTILKW